MCLCVVLLIYVWSFSTLNYGERKFGGNKSLARQSCIAFYNYSLPKLFMDKCVKFFLQTFLVIGMHYALDRFFAFCTAVFKLLVFN